MRGQIVWKMRRYKYPTINTDTYRMNEDEDWKEEEKGRREEGKEEKEEKIDQKEKGREE